MTKPLFRWVLPPDGQQRPAKDIVGHCVSIQRLFFEIQEGRMKTTQAGDLIEAMHEVMVEHGIQIIEPRWFADLLSVSAKRKSLAHVG